MPSASEYKLTTGQVAAQLDVSDEQVHRAVDRGQLPCVRTLGGHRRFRQADVDRLLDEMYEEAQ
jgi:excisionase family DNA binding protein